MAQEVKCAICGKVHEVKDTHKIKWCPNCEMWICKDCVKYGTDCPRCKKAVK